MRRLWRIWVQFGVCAALVIAAMAQVSLMAVRLDRKQAAAERREREEGNILLALMRMEAMLTPLVGRESARPYRHFRAFYGSRDAYPSAGHVLNPSPLLRGPPPDITLHFQLRPDGSPESPQVPIQEDRKRWAENRRYTNSHAIREYKRRLSILTENVSYESLMDRLADPEEKVGRSKAMRHAVADDEAPDTYRNRVEELRQRREAVEQAIQPLDSSRSYGARDGAMRALFTGHHLLLVRQVSDESGSRIQGCWLDWHRIKSKLLAAIKEELPNADLGLWVGSHSEDLQNLQSKALWPLAAIDNIRLVPGEIPLDTGAGASAIQVSLGFAWVCMLAAAGAVAALLHGAVSLSERRAAFVSAVTHELRTPLTTFRMYTEMLAEDMVPPGPQRAQYFETMLVEANRLGHLVENVLAFARLERGRHGGQKEVIGVGVMLDRFQERLDQRAARAEMTVEAAWKELPDDVRVNVDVGAMEQILFNLVDNASKYAVQAEDRRIVISAEANDNKVILRIRDFGPGIPGDIRRKLFKPFTKSAKDAAHSAPGVGLGLSLCRRLAKTIGGRVRLDRGIEPGACFLLTFTRASQDDE
jgi:signal transduction histidine kinase